MRVKVHSVFWCILTYFLLTVPCSGGGKVKVSWFPLELKQGDVLCVTVRPETEIASVTGDLEGTPIYFYKQKQSGLAGIVGVDLATAPGQRHLRVEVTDPEGRSFEQVFPVQVVPGGFEVQHLTLPKKQVDLKGEALRRVLAENRRLIKIFNQVRHQQLWCHSFIMPVDGPITSSFGLRRILNDKPRSPHSGVDIGAPEGTEVASCNDGIVVLVEELYLCGKTIIIDHGCGLYSMYFHLSETRVNQGDQVGIGECIGLVGATGRVTGAHLHWGIRLLGARVDPFSLLKVVPPGE